LATPCHPAAAAANGFDRSDLSPHEENETEPESAARGTHRLAGFPIGIVGTAKALEIVGIPADQIRRHGQQFEIFTVQGYQCVSTPGAFLGRRGHRFRRLTQFDVFYLRTPDKEDFSRLRMPYSTLWFEANSALDFP